MKHWMKALSLTLCAAALLTLPVLASDPPAPVDAPAAPAAVRVWGSVKRLENGSLELTNSDQDDPLNDVIVHLPEGVPCLDAATGLPLDPSQIRDGATVYAWVGPAMTLSLPPQATALAVVGNLPADSAAPEFYEVTGVDQTVTIAIYPPPPRTQVQLPVAGGGTLTIPLTAEILPYRTKNIVTVDDLVPGSQILVWRGTDGQVRRVVMLPYGHRGYVTVRGSQVSVDGQTLAAPAGPDGMLPIRAVAEAAGYDVSWVPGLGAVVKDGDRTVFTALPGSSAALRPGNEDGDWTLSAPCLYRSGTTYLAPSDLTMLLDLYLCGE